MAFPQVTGYGTNEGDTTTITKTIPIPGSFVAGDLLFAWIFTGINRTYAWQAGWTEFRDSAGVGFAYRIADGSEGANVAVNQSGLANSIQGCIRVAGALAFAPSFGVSSATTSTPNPPLLSPSGVAEDILWMALAVHNDAGAILLTYPASYSQNQHSAVNSDGGGNAGAFEIASRELTAASEDPGSFTLLSSSASQAFTLAFFPEPALMGQMML